MHGWDDNQRALQLVSYLDETAMNVAQELGDDELYDYVSRPSGPYSMAGYDVIMKTQIRLLT